MMYKKDQSPEEKNRKRGDERLHKIFNYLTEHPKATREEVYKELNIEELTN